MERSAPSRNVSDVDTTSRGDLARSTEAEGRGKVRRSMPVHRLRNRIRIALRSHRGPTPEKQVLILATARSGSNLLVSYLNHHSDVSLASEVLNPNLHIGLRKRFVTRRAVLRHIVRSVRSRGRLVSGAKFHLNQLNERRMTVEDLHGLFPSARVIVLYRRSLAHQYVSTQVARSIGRWLDTTGSAVFEGTVHVDPQELLGFYHWIREQYREVVANGWLRERGVLVAYEDMAADPQTLFGDRLFPFLGLPSSEVRTNMVKQVPHPLSKVVANYDDVRHLLHGGHSMLELEV